MRGFFDLFRLAGVKVDGQDLGRAQLGEMAGLAARSGAGVEDGSSPGRSGVQGNELRRLVLRLEQPLLVPFDVESGRGARSEDEGIRGVLTRGGNDSLLAERAPHLVARRLAPCHPHRRRRLLLVCRAKLLRLFETEPFRPPLDHPARMRVRRGDVPCRVDFPRGEGGRGARLRESAQHRVRVTRGARCSQRPHQLDALIDHGPRRHTGMVEKLERGQPERRADVRVELLGRSLGMDRDRAIELQLPTQRSVGELGRERRLARLERPRGPERPVEGEVREGASLLDAEEHFRGDATRGRDRHGRLVTLRPTAVYRRRMPPRVAPTCKGRIQSCRMRNLQHRSRLWEPHGRRRASR